MKSELIIKSMVCPRCITAVEDVFNALDIQVENIQLGKVKTKKSLTENLKKQLEINLIKLGFELLDDKNTQIISKIKSIIIKEIHHSNQERLNNFSTILSDDLHYDYTYLSRLFSSVEGRTIEQYILIQKVEKIKELLTYGEMQLSEISFVMNYSSLSHLSSQFKKITGMTPSAFKKIQHNERNNLDSL